MAGRDAMDLQIAKRIPDAEYRDIWVWFQSGINTNGAHNPFTGRLLQRRDILSPNTFPMISGYYTALECTMFDEEVADASRAIWKANVAAHEYGMWLLKPGTSSTEVTEKTYYRGRRQHGGIRVRLAGVATDGDREGPCMPPSMSSLAGHFSGLLGFRF